METKSKRDKYDLDAATQAVLKLKGEAELCHKKGKDSYIALGKKLMEVKSHLKHGEWSPWLKRVGIAERTAQVYMAVAKNPKSYDDALGNLADVRTTERKNGAKGASLADSSGGNRKTSTTKISRGSAPNNGHGDGIAPTSKELVQKVGEMTNEWVLLVNQVKINDLGEEDRTALRGHLKSVQARCEERLKEMNSEAPCASISSQPALATSRS